MEKRQYRILVKAVEIYYVMLNMLNFIFKMFEMIHNCLEYAHYNELY